MFSWKLYETEKEMFGICDRNDFIKFHYNISDNNLICVSLLPLYYEKYAWLGRKITVILDQPFFSLSEAQL